MNPSPLAQYICCSGTWNTGKQFAYVKVNTGKPAFITNICDTESLQKREPYPTLHLGSSPLPPWRSAVLKAPAL